MFQVFLNVKFLDFEIELGVQVFPNDPHFILQRKTHERCHLRRPAGHLLGFSFHICHLSHDDDDDDDDDDDNEDGDLTLLMGIGWNEFGWGEFAAT